MLKTSYRNKGISSQVQDGIWARSRKKAETEPFEPKTIYCKKK